MSRSTLPPKRTPTITLDEEHAEKLRWVAERAGYTAAKDGQTDLDRCAMWCVLARWLARWEGYQRIDRANAADLKTTKGRTT